MNNELERMWKEATMA